MSRKIIGVTVGTTLNPKRLEEHVKDGKSAYEIAIENGFEGTEAEWLESLKGEDGKDGANGKDGAAGKDGADGVSVLSVTQTTSSSADGGINVVTVTLSNGNKSAFTFRNGSKGSAGADGAAGVDGVGIARVYKATSSGKVDTYNITLTDGTVYTFTVTNGKDGVDGTDGVDGEDGKTPYIQNGYWYIGGVNTNVKAQGVNGKDGQDGKDGEDGYDGIDGRSVEISVVSDYIVWRYVGDTAWRNLVALETISGKDGKDGVDGTNGKDGANGVDGKDGANGTDGKDGADGQRGTGILKVTTAPTSYTTSTAGISPIKRMAISTIKTQSGVSEVLVGDCVGYSYYLYHIYYVDATYAYMDKYQSIRGATGAAGADGLDGKDGADGYTPVKGTDYFTEADKTEMVNAVKAALPYETWTFELEDGTTVSKVVLLK